MPQDVPRRLPYILEAMRWPKCSGFMHRVRMQDRDHGRVVPIWAPAVLAGCTVALIPWTALLLYELPNTQVAHHWNLAWAGFDVAIAAALTATAITVLRRSGWATVAATTTGTLLIVDAWFDIVTSAGAGERFWVAVGMAALCELPLAVGCLLIARNVERVTEQATRFVLAAGYTVENRRLVPPRDPSPTQPPGSPSTPPL